MTDNNKTVVAIYAPNFLSRSMTFVYRQLLGISDEFRPIVLTERRDNEALFPYNDILVVGYSPLERFCAASVRRLLGCRLPMSTGRRRAYEIDLVSKNAELIHAHFGPSGVEALRLARSRGLPLLVTFHGNDASSALRRSCYRWQLKQVFDYAYVIAVSQEMKDRLVRLGASPERTFVHYIGVPLKDFRQLPRRSLGDKAANGERLTLLQVANFVEKKGHEYTLRAFKQFLAEYKNAKLILAGDGPLLQPMRRLCSKLGIDEDVECVGPVARKQVIELMDGADLFLHHSVTARNGSQEGIPTVLMEAMATGLVVISTRHAGIPELVKDRYNGYLVAERDVAGYVRTLKNALTASDDIPRRAYETVAKNFNLEVQNEKLKSVYGKVIEEHARENK
jgi:colanic acid/amylovoran biosynthesis glycosyltransferase